LAGRLKNRAGGKAAYFNRFSLFQTAFRTIRPSEKLGRVDIQLLKRILRQMPFYGVKASKMLIVNTP